MKRMLFAIFAVLVLFSPLYAGDLGIKLQKKPVLLSQKHQPQLNTARNCYQPEGIFDHQYPSIKFSYRSQKLLRLLMAGTSYLPSSTGSGGWTEKISFKRT